MYTISMPFPPLSQPEPLQSITAQQAEEAASRFSTPTYTYNEAMLTSRAQEALDFQAPYGLTVRYAMKANPNPQILQLFNQLGLHIDASSGYEARHALSLGIPAEHIMITSQQIPDDLRELVGQGVLYNATSLHQLETYGRLFPHTDISVRINPGIGSGHSKKANTGGPSSSFGIWHEYIGQIKELAQINSLNISKIHTHIGAGTDPKVWHEAARLTLEMAEHFPTVSIINLGGGFKVARTSAEHGTDLPQISGVISRLFQDFAAQTGRRLHIEIEPGTFLVANAGAIVSRVIDITDTGAQGNTFLKLDTGLTEIMRPSLYGAQHAIVVVNDRPRRTQNYVVVGHTCESGDLLTPEPGQPDTPSSRPLQSAAIGDLVVIEGTGAYCASLSATGYNSFPPAAEVMITGEGDLSDAAGHLTATAGDL